MQPFPHQISIPYHYNHPYTCITLSLCSCTKAILDRQTEPSQPGQRSHYALRGADAHSTSPKDAFIVYYTKMAMNNKVFLFDATVVPHTAVLLFSNANLVWNSDRDRVSVGGWIEMCITELHCVLFRRLQREIESLLRAKVEDPTLDIADRQCTLRHAVLALVQ